ncbi:MAG: 2-hydroxychromene-2-carboxylate isomerase [Pseudomonadota bacterium]
MPRTIDYYFTVSSPWSYLGHQRFMELVGQYKLAVDYRPMRLGQVFEATGGLPLPKRAPARQAYRMYELKRWREFLSIDLNLEPKFFPVDDLPATQLVNYAEDRLCDMDQLLMAIWRAVWVQEKNIADPEHLRTILKQLDLDPAWVDEAAKDEAANSRIDSDSNAAITAGVVGAPGYVFQGEPFWGQDRLDLLGWRLYQTFEA